MKILVAFSGGKDSHASLLLAVQKWGAKNVTAVYCDTQWEHALIYPFIEDVCKRLEVELVILQAEYSFIELAIKRGRFPSTKAKFCTEVLKVKPMIDYVLLQLEKHEYLIVVQGIRKDESEARSKMEAHCQYFKYYFTPYGHDKKGKPKYFTYRKKDIIRLEALAKVDIERPVFGKTAQEVIVDILDADHKPNPLYYLGVGRVGCFPCIMVTHWELYILITKEPAYETRLIEAEAKVGRSFFRNGYIPHRYNDQGNGKETWPSCQRVFEYIRMKNSQGQLHPEPDNGRSCMTAFNICE